MDIICQWFLLELDTSSIDLIVNLIIDIGNTRTKVAIFSPLGLFHFEVFKTFGVQKVRHFIKKYRINSCILSNSGLVAANLINELSGIKQFIHFNKDTKLPIKNTYDSKDTLGIDRLAGAIGTLLYFPCGSTLKIDMGTCITMDYLDSKLEFVGGNISPGISMRLKSMHHFTAKLPLVDIGINEEIFGKTTTTAMQNGAVKGAFREIDSFIEGIRDEFGTINVILTGGDANLFEKYTKNESFVAPFLVLEGLNETLKYNAYKN